MGLCTFGSLQHYLLILARKTLAEDYEIFPQSDTTDMKELMVFQSKCMKDIVDGMVYLSSEQVSLCMCVCHFSGSRKGGVT